MDERDDDRPEEWSAPAGLVGTGIVATLAFAGVAALTSDTSARVLAAVAAAALAMLTAFAARARPRLAARPDELAVRGMWTTRRWPWDAVDAVRTLRARRLVFHTSYLEIDVREPDGSDHLLLLGRLELGADPAEVADALQRRRARAGRNRDT